MGVHVTRIVSIIMRRCVVHVVAVWITSDPFDVRESITGNPGTVLASVAWRRSTSGADGCAGGEVSAGAALIAICGIPGEAWQKFPSAAVCPGRTDGRSPGLLLILLLDSVSYTHLTLPTIYTV